MKIKKIAVPLICSVMILSSIIIVVEIASRITGTTIYVDDDYGSEDATHKKTIQAAVENASNGDTIYVYNGLYYGLVIVEKTLNIIGENRNSTIIYGEGGSGSMWVRYIEYVNVSGFTFRDGGTGISIYHSNYSKVENCKAINNQYGIIVGYSNGTVVRNNIAIENHNYHGIYIDESTNILVENNILLNNSVGIRLYPSSDNNIIRNNYCNGNGYGIWIGTWSDNNLIFNNTIVSSLTYGIWDSSDGGNIYLNISIKDSRSGFCIGTFTQDVLMLNSTIENSTDYDIIVAGSTTSFTTINTTFNKTKVRFGGLPTNFLTVKWYLHVNVIDNLGNPVPNANVKIEDSKNSSNQDFYITDSNGDIRWLTVTEYKETDSDDDEVGEKTYHTPHKIVAWNNTLVGYAQPIMNESKTVTIVLYNGTLLDLEPGWNLISLPRIQSDNNLPTALQSIEGQYDAVQWYNVSDNNDPWKHNHISKPSDLNDLNNVNHTMGLWVHITDPGGTTLVVFGDVLTSTQDIALYPGWNLVGYPSTTDKIRISALNNIFFDTDVDAIWTYNATTQTWKEITASDDFEVGRGYWIHSKVTKTWIVPL
jgi:parallel beta-helix repeat protein